MRSQIVLGFLVAFIHLYTTTDAKALYVKDIINNESTALGKYTSQTMFSFMILIFICFCLFCLFVALHHGQQFFSHFGTASMV